MCVTAYPSRWLNIFSRCSKSLPMKSTSKALSVAVSLKGIVSHTNSTPLRHTQKCAASWELTTSCVLSCSMKNGRPGTNALMVRKRLRLVSTRSDALSVISYESLMTDVVLLDW